MPTLRKNKDAGLDKAIDNLLAEMERVNGDSEEYAQLADQLIKLYSIKKDKNNDRLSMDTLATVVGNLAGIAIIVNYERLNVVTSKALGFVLKAK